MKKWIILSFLVISQVVHAETCSYTEETFSQWMMEYFRAPQPNRVDCSLSYYANSKLFQEYVSGRMPAAHFFAHALEERAFIPLFERLSVDSTLTEKMFALHVFWVKNTDQSNALLKKAGATWPEAEITVMVPKMEAPRPTNFLTQGPKSAVALDNLWAIFFATGNEDAIRQISSVLHLLEGSGVDILIGGAASWSLASNAKHYPEVRAIVEELAKEAEGSQKKALEEVLANADGKTHNKALTPFVALVLTRTHGFAADRIAWH